MSITHLSGDTLTAITEWLTSDALGALVLCGNTLLNRKLAHHVQSIRSFSLRNDFVWPFYMRGWTAIKHLTIQIGNAVCELDVSKFALGKRIFESLPHSLESLILLNCPEWLQTVTHSIWHGRARHLLATQFSLFVDEGDGKYNDDCAAFIVDVATGSKPQTWLAALQHLYLPRLETFSCKNFILTNNRWSYWWGAHAPTSLTHLTLDKLTLTPFDAPLCDAFRALPRTLVTLKLKSIDNTSIDYKHRNSFVRSPSDVFTNNTTTASLSSPEAQMLGALPPHLTHLTLSLFRASPMPASTLEHLDDLVTFQFAVASMSCRLPRLPNNIHTLKLKGFDTVVLNECLSSIPETHCSLRRLAINCIRIPLGLKFDSAFCPLFNTIMTRTPFIGLESLHVCTGLIRIRIPDTCDSSNINYEGVKRMIRLRSINSFFMLPFFSGFWKCVTPLLSSKSPMHIHTEAHSPIRLKRWLDSTNIAIVDMPHITANHFDMTSYVPEVVSYVICHPIYNEVKSEVSLTTFITSVKHLTITNLCAKIVNKLLKYWPNTLETLTLSTKDEEGFDVSFFSTAIATRALRALRIINPTPIPDINDWLRAMPTSLELLEVECSKTDESKPVLTFIPPRLNYLTICRGFVISAATFNAVPSSLRRVNWKDVDVLQCSSSDLCRWPKHMQSIHISAERMSPEYTHCDDDFSQWVEKTKTLYYANLCYTKNNGDVYTFLMDRRGSNVM